MYRGDSLEVTVLTDHREAVLYSRCGDQGVGELDGAVDSSGLAVGNEARPRDHHCLADRDWIRGAGQGKSVGAAGAARVVGSVEHAELKLTDRHHRHGYPIGKLTQRSSRLAGDEDRGVQQAGRRCRQSSSRVWPASSSSSWRRAGSAERSSSCSRRLGAAQPPCALTVGDDVGERVAVDGQDNPLASLYGVYDARRAVA